MLRAEEERQSLSDLPLTHIGGTPVAFATRKAIAMSSQFLGYRFQFN